MSKTRPKESGSGSGARVFNGASLTNSASAVVAATSSAPKGDDDMKKTKYIAKVTSDAIKMSRCEKKLTQKELAQKCNMDVSIISEIERGVCVYQAGHINKIQSVLGVKIPRE
jgi:ribosome-binding protein aMBF1 (putative translation factor)